MSDEKRLNEMYERLGRFPCILVSPISAGFAHGAMESMRRINAVQSKVSKDLFLKWLEESHTSILPRAEFIEWKYAQYLQGYSGTEGVMSQFANDEDER